jgi:hypothetical protein
VKAFVAALALVPWLATAQPADVAAIQAREARHADARTLAALERFRAALVERYGDPKLTMLTFGESEGEALVLRPGGATEHVIRQGDRWISTDGRKLAPWTGAGVAAANAFALSSVRAEPIRAWLETWRKAPGQATDFVTGYAIGYEPAQARIVVRATVGSMTTGRLSRQTFAAK